MSLYIVMLLEKNIETIVLGSEGAKEFKVPVSWAEGMVGVLPVFKDAQAAAKYANNKHEVVEIQEVGG